MTLANPSFISTHFAAVKNIKTLIIVGVLGCCELSSKSQKMQIPHVMPKSILHLVAYSITFGLLYPWIWIISFDIGIYKIMFVCI